ncbi:UDP-N-acetylmuramoyl-L-alanine--D-glutamate ligase [bacterium]|nr:UDP-N-acetylmuramoyl-L-alanine--D-glutamate ligase [bacterium]
MGSGVGGKTFWVVGLARSGCAAGRLLRRHGAVVIGIDDAEDAAVRRRWESEGLTDLAPEAFDEIHAGGGWPMPAPHAVVISPGVRPDHPRLRSLDPGLEVIGELELAARFCRARLVAITGTNGKSTTTEWTARLLEGAGLRAEAVGNLGRPLALVADELGPADVAVVEVSSFQLETTRLFAPEVGAVLNLAPDHLDRYPDLAAYYAAKRILPGLIPGTGSFVAWTGCPEALSWPTRGRRMSFGDRDQGADAYLSEGKMRCRWRGEEISLVPVGDLSLQSPPNLLNAQAAVAIGLGLGIEPERLAPGLRDYRGLAHRHQPVGALDGVEFIDDSKATNVHAVCAGLRGYPRPVVLIAGGSGKGEDFSALAEVMQSVVHVVLIGEEGPRIGEALEGVVPLSRAGTLEEAVGLAAGIARGRERAVVLLSPACASFDMFANYRARGAAFASAARSLGAVMIE